MDKGQQQLASLISQVRTDLHLYGDKLLSTMEKIMASLDDLVAKVKNEGDVIDSAITLIQGLRDKLGAAGTDPAKLQDLADAMDAQVGKLAAAVASGTIAGGSTPSVDATPSAPSAPVDATLAAPAATAPAEPAPAPDAPASTPPDTANSPT